MKALQLKNGWITPARHCPSPHFSPRPAGEDVSLLVVHNISLPPEQFAGDYISDLFLGCLDCDADPYFDQLRGLRVSAHCLIRRDGELVQYVSFDDQAWHAGVSNFNGRERCNEFSIGIELEGSDHQPFTSEQYRQLATLGATIMSHYPSIVIDNITGHSDIAPGRKTDPGPFFKWQHFKDLLETQL